MNTIDRINKCVGATTKIWRVRKKAPATDTKATT